MKAKRLTLFQKTNSPDIPKVIDEIENEVYYNLKPLGFKKYGRTLHRFVSGGYFSGYKFSKWAISKDTIRIFLC